MISLKKQCRKIPCLLSHIQDLPDKVGVYGFFQRGSGQCIYIGKTEQQGIRKRVKQHWVNSKSPVLGRWIKNFPERLEIAYVPIEFQKMHRVDSLETRLIRLWHPAGNTIKKTTKKRKGAKPWA